jgi:type I restriction enzyme S subunit
MVTSKLPEQWRWAVIADISVDKYGLVDGPFGSSLPASCYTPQGIPVIRGSNLTLGSKQFIADEFVYVSEATARRLARSLCHPQDIIFTKKGTLGQTGFVPLDGPSEEYLLSSNQMKLTVDRRVADPLFVYYYVSSPASQEKIIRDSEATGVPKINLAYLRTFPIPLPPLPEQRAIASILGSLDDKIELNRRMNATLEAIAQALFKSWFVDFDPVRARMEGRQPFGMDAETAALFPNRFEESALGEIPAGWSTMVLGAFVRLEKGLSYKGQYLAEVGKPMINLGCFRGQGRFSTDNLKYYTGEYKQSQTIRPGEIVMANTDITQKRYVLGSPAIVPASDIYEEYLFTHHVYALRMDVPKASWRDFVYYSLLQPGFRERAIGFATGTTVLALPRDAVLNYEVAVPLEEVISAFNSHVEPLHLRVHSNNLEINSLAMLRDVLIPKLLSAELRVVAEQPATAPRAEMALLAACRREGSPGGI